MNLGHLKIFLIVLFFCNQLQSEPLQMKFANFKLLDKISNNLIEDFIPVNGSKVIGTLEIEVYACLKEPPDEIPEDYVLIDVYDTINNENINIYKGWMISSSPDVTPLENPIYDLWLVDCSNDKTS